MYAEAYARGSQRAEDAVAGIAQAGDDVAVLVEMVVDGCDVDGDVGMRCIDGVYAFRRSDKAQEDDALRTLLFQEVERCDGTAARGEHGIDDDEHALADIARQLAEVFDGLQRRRVAVEADVADAGGGYEAQHAFRHAESRTQDGDDAELLARELLRMAGSYGRLDLDILKRQLARDLVSHEHGDLFEKLAEVLRARFLLAHERELVLDATKFDPYTGERSYENFPTFEFGGDKCAELDQFKIGEVVTVSFDLQGTKYEKDGQTKFFTRVRGYKVERRQVQQSVQSPQQGGASQQPVASSAQQSGSDLPF